MGPHSNIHNSQKVDRNCGNLSLVSDIIEFILDIISNENVYAGLHMLGYTIAWNTSYSPTYILQQYPRLIPWLLPLIP